MNTIKRLTLLALGMMTLLTACKDPEVTEVRYLASATTTTTLYTLDEEAQMLHPAGDFLRGTAVVAYPNCTEKAGDVCYWKVAHEGSEFYVREDALVLTPREVVKEQSVWVRTPATIIGNPENSTIAGFADKSAELTVLGYDSLRTDGSVATYRVRLGEVEGYIYGKYTVFSPEEAALRYKADLYDPIHKKVKNSFGGGEAIGCDFYPVEKPAFEDNKMPHACYSLYLNSGTNVLKNIEAYIALAKKSRINTFVIDIKDNESPGYKAEAMKTYSPPTIRGRATRRPSTVR